MQWGWEQFQPYVDELLGVVLSPANVEHWLTDWSNLRRVVTEMAERLYVATTLNTADAEAEQRFNRYLDEIYPQAQASDQALKEMLLRSGLEPAGFEIPLRNMRAEAAIFCQQNLPLLSEERKLSNTYDRIIGAQTINWDGQEKTLSQLRPVYQEQDRTLRERAWRAASERQLLDRQPLSELWQKLIALRGQVAANAGFADYRSYRWQELLRFDYTPQDCARFHDAIEQEALPLVRRIIEKRCRRLGISSLRPWDKDVDPLGRPPLRPYQTIDQLVETSGRIFDRVDPQLGRYFDLMRRQGLMDLDNRKGKAPGAYCTAFSWAGVPFMFVNAVGLHDDVQTTLHEAGHAFHVFESIHLPYHHQLAVGMEFAEVASTAMELLAAPYLATREGGFYAEQDAARARIQFLESTVLFWPYMAVVDAFQHWVYENHAAASDPANCDAKWRELWGRFMQAEDWSGLDDAAMTGWQRKLHIFQVPFYYIEYGIAQLGALQVWRNALKDQVGAVAAYRKALALGGSVSLPALYAAAGAKFSFDASMVRQAVQLVEEVIERLEQVS
ncbi:MAG: M3 family oligoendopeptidase [Anaerolineales bacterium]|nr:M3 family oligoendopeptidase [Anaerolineales bacterium]